MRIKGQAFVLLFSLAFPLLLGAAPREITFKGEIWQVKSSDSKIAPGPNYWSDADDQVWVDTEGMHLTIKRKYGRWQCSEVNTKGITGYGTYTFVVDSSFATYDPNVVAGFFTWDSQKEEANREIDIEFAAWGQSTGTRGQFVVQPYTTDDRIVTFDPQMQGTYSTHRIVWTPDTIIFSSYHGEVNPDEQASKLNLMQQWQFTGKPPSSGNAHFRINLWLFQGKKPLAPASLTIKSFSFQQWEG
ncbi:membrane-bound serine protease (ClpP class) [Sphaerochaeta pleomorpha str. Grapes]|uniref:Membrane-bound serine protease (ClpP class) n=1 Tax=Sphaerochaeta pleomorpha (strain ATCC BAA-1885 / DSM 22778 / Grapes) TaxID=158190 RepID=G8QVJ9_SPHPG|nr:family 16 glycosylhydrolase [Sphaerochaeta pleomorpha]AEV28232.1 membrane-bound serine protease (ClpP class) [Sphaerochaeta pleomorpha str. Grapes]